jgi:MFS transporter, DHA2 family, multidrug resistance protein
MTATVDSTEYPPPFQRAMILVTVTFATMLYGMTILIVTVILPQMQGTLSATTDQISWAMTLNIVATAVVTPMTGWLAQNFGRRRVMLYSVFGFTIATVFCGMADSLESLILYRIFQGAFGAPLVPLANAIILDVYPREKHGMATAIFGMGVVIGPVFGPVFGGMLTELYNWRWAFFMIVPFGVFGFFALWWVLPSVAPRRSVRFDWVGFLALSLAVVSLQIFLDQGQRNDWLDSTAMILFASAAAFGFYLFCVHSLIARAPFLNLRLLRDRNYALGLMIVTVYGMLNFTPVVMMPPMLKELMGFPESIIGLLVSARGAGALIGFFLSIWVGKLDPRIGMTIGFSLQGFTGWWMAGFDMNVTSMDVAFASWVQGISIGLIWVPLVSATFKTMDRVHLEETTAVFHLLRNIGSSIFIALSVAVLIRSTGVNYARMVEFVTPFNPIMALPSVSALWDLASVKGLAAASSEISRQAKMIGYINAFGLYTMASFIALPLVWCVRNPKS